MQRRVIVAFVMVMASCDAVHLRLDDVVAPAAPPDQSEVFPTTSGPESACSPRCVGGRQCVEGACTPHWLPVPSPEVSGSEPRVGHYAVWTGTEVIVWGGHNPRVAGPSGIFGDGFRFDPTRSEVRALSQQSAPAARFADGAQAAVWTGHEMIIWGGRTASGELSDGAAYVPSSDRWVTFAGAMAPRTNFTTVFTGTSVLLAGAGGPDDNWRWSASIGSWVHATPGTASVMQPRAGHSAVWSGDELVVWGGVDAAGNTLSDGWRFSPARRRAKPLGMTGAPPARTQHTAVWAGSEMLVFGGRGYDGGPVASLASYVPAIDAWREVSSEGAPSARFDHVAVWTGRSLIVWGGTDGRRPLQDGGEYDPWENSWTRLDGVVAAGETVAREGAAGVWTGSELIVIGGSDGTARIAPLGWRYQP